MFLTEKFPAKVNIRDLLKSNEAHIWIDLPEDMKPLLSENASASSKMFELQTSNAVLIVNIVLLDSFTLKPYGSFLWGVQLSQERIRERKARI